MLNLIKEKIDKYNNILLSAHVSPDGDAIGSLLAFKYMIEKYNKDKNVSIVLQDNLPKYMKYFDESSDILKDYNKENIELVIMLDTANIKRAAIDNEVFSLAKETINIDHHISNTKYLNINYVEDVSSTSELIFKFIDIFNIRLDEKIAKFMYLGIINDTGNFRHPNVTEKTFFVCSKLLEVGVNTSLISYILFYKNEKKARIFGKALLEYILVEDINFAYFIANREMMNKYDLESDDVDGIAELLMSIEKIDSTLFLREDEEGIFKGSLRSRKYDVNRVASLLDGGGHILAAGFKANKCSKDILNIIVEGLRSQKC